MDLGETYYRSEVFWSLSHIRRYMISIGLSTDSINFDNFVSVDLWEFFFVNLLFFFFFLFILYLLEERQ